MSFNKLEQDTHTRHKNQIIGAWSVPIANKKLLNLSKRLCPNGVEWKKLGQICNIQGRIGFRGYTRNDQVKEGEGALSLSPSNIQDGQMDYSKGTYITWAKYEESPEIIDDDNIEKDLDNEKSEESEATDEIINEADESEG